MKGLDSGKQILLSLFVLCCFFTHNIFAQTTTTENTPTISIDETAYIEVAPDLAILSVQVYLEGREAADIEEKAYQKAKDIVKVFKKYGISSEDYETTNNTLNDQRWKTQTTKSISLGFEVKLKEIGRLDQFRNDVVEAGATVFTIQSFENLEAEKFVNEAAENALKKAMKNASNLAAIANMKLGQPLSIRVQNQSIRPEMRSAKASGLMMTNDSVQSRDDEPTVNKTTVRYRATVYVEFEMYQN
jgi:uncharacterized protein YggE